MLVSECKCSDMFTRLLRIHILCIHVACALARVSVVFDRTLLDSAFTEICELNITYQANNMVHVAVQFHIVAPDTFRSAG